MNYSDYFKDPQWANFRKRVLERDGNACTVCGTKRMLQVHHKLYCHDLAPWEYELQHVVTLCRKCHDEVEFVIAAVRDNPWLSGRIINRITDDMMERERNGV